MAFPHLGWWNNVHALAGREDGSPGRASKKELDSGPGRVFPTTRCHAVVSPEMGGFFFAYGFLSRLPAFACPTPRTVSQAQGFDLEMGVIARVSAGWVNLCMREREFPLKIWLGALYATLTRGLKGWKARGAIAAVDGTM